jgi:hypothetical protein
MLSDEQVSTVHATTAMRHCPLRPVARLLHINSPFRRFDHRRRGAWSRTRPVTSHRLWHGPQPMSAARL